MPEPRVTARARSLRVSREAGPLLWLAGKSTFLHRHFLELLLGLKTVPGPIRSHERSCQYSLLRYYFLWSLSLQDHLLTMYRGPTWLLRSSTEVMAIKQPAVLGSSPRITSQLWALINHFISQAHFASGKTVQCHLPTPKLFCENYFMSCNEL